jgi:ubiquinone/menaquinone biosynthesis C-methylase UbiE
MNIRNHNQNAWNKYVEKKDKWTIPFSEKEINEAKNGNWAIVLTPKMPVPKTWFPDFKGLKILGLASGGGQQGPILAALGADVTIYDLSENQLAQDKKVSNEFGLNIKTVQGDMRDLSVFEDESFDLIFNPCSIVFVEELKPVWKECFRVLKPNGILMTGLMNPIVFQIDEENLKLTYKSPFSDLNSLPKEKLDALIQQDEALVFGHSWTDQISEQLKAGFMLTDMYEDTWGGENVFDEYFPGFMATRAMKIELRSSY